MIPSKNTPAGTVPVTEASAAPANDQGPHAANESSYGSWSRLSEEERAALGFRASAVPPAPSSSSGPSTPRPTLDEVLPRGVLLTLWHSNGLARALEESRAFLREVRPQVVQLHAGPQNLTTSVARVARSVRELLPGVVLIVGVAWDGWIENYNRADPAKAEGRAERQRIEDTYLAAVKAAYDAGCVMVVINSEAKGKQYPRAARALGAKLIDAIRGACPGMLLAHTAYDHPHYHPEERNHGGHLDADDEGYPWSVYLGGAAARRVEGLVLPSTGRVDVSMEQIYAAPAATEGGHTPMADLGALGRRIASSRSSFARAEALDWIDPTVAHVGYQQMHHIPAAAIAGCNARTPRVAFWASPTRMDAHGRAGVAVLAKARRGELTLDGADALTAAAIRAWAQGRLGIDGGTAWGTWGPKSRAACAEYQARVGITASGELDAATLTALQAELTQETAR